jgi:1-acyl-sn-glycerol-3-phosphate acyltransferase
MLIVNLSSFFFCQDKDNLARKLNQLLDYPSPVWILLFPEGTRFNAEKHAASREFAASRGLPQLQHHLLPRTKGFSFTGVHIGIFVVIYFNRSLFHKRFYHKF